MGNADINHSLSFEGLYYTLRIIQIDDSAATALSKSGIDHPEEDENLKELKIRLLTSNIFAEGYLIVRNRYFFDIYNNDGYAQYPDKIAKLNFEFKRKIKGKILIHERVTKNRISSVTKNDSFKPDEISIEALTVPRILGRTIKLATGKFNGEPLRFISEKNYKEFYSLHSF